MKLLKNLFNREKNEKANIVQDKNERLLAKIGREQFIRLKEKGLSVRIFSL